MRKLRTGSLSARAWGGQAVGITPTEKLKLRRQMAAAAGKKDSVSLSLLKKGRACLGGWNMDGKMGKRAEKIFEVLERKKVRGPAGAVMCETRALGNKWPRWHALLFVKGKWRKQAKTVGWKKCAAKHECTSVRSYKRECGWNQSSFAAKKDQRDADR